MLLRKAVSKDLLTSFFEQLFRVLVGLGGPRIRASGGVFLGLPAALGRSWGFFKKRTGRHDDKLFFVVIVIFEGGKFTPPQPVHSKADATTRGTAAPRLRAPEGDGVSEEEEEEEQGRCFHVMVPLCSYLLTFPNGLLSPGIPGNFLSLIHISEPTRP